MAVMKIKILISRAYEYNKFECGFEEDFEYYDLSEVRERAKMLREGARKQVLDEIEEYKRCKQ